VNGHPSKQTLHDIEVNCWIELPFGRGFAKGDSLLAMATSDPNQFMVVVDYLLSRQYAGQAVKDLEGMLLSGGSTYRVISTNRPFRLERRVDASLQAVADAALTRGDRPGELLRSAWVHAFGVRPVPGHAFREAIRAVEAAAKPVVTPSDQKTTLGRIIGQLRATPADFDVVLRPTEGSPVEHLIEMLLLLWRSEFDRHGSDDETVPIEVSQSQAEAAVQLAAVVVQWFTDGAVFKRP
jgi:hypothetical protein